MFSCGAVLYEMATGKIPFEGSSSGEVCGAILHQLPAPVSQVNPQIAGAVESIINKALEKDRNLRYQHASDVGADLRRLKRDTEPGKEGRPVAARARASSGNRAPASAAGQDSTIRNRAIVRTLSGLFCVVIAGIVLLLYKHQSSRVIIDSKASGPRN